MVYLVNCEMLILEAKYCMFGIILGLDMIGHIFLSIHFSDTFGKNVFLEVVIKINDFKTILKITRDPI